MQNFFIRKFRLGFLLSLTVLGLIAAFIFTPSYFRIEASKNKTAKKTVNGEFVPGEILVRYRTEAKARYEENAAQPLVANDGSVIDVDVQQFDGSELVEGLRLARVAPEETLEAIAALNARSDVLYAEPNYIMLTTATPNDQRFEEQYSMLRVSAPQAWDITQGSQAVVVGVVDSGVDINHPDLKDNIWTNPGETPNDNVDNDGNGFVDDVNGWDFAANDKTVFDNATNDAHGTHVAGTIGARGNNTIGVTGVNWNVSIASLKICAPSCSTSNAIKAYNYARMMKERGVNLRVLNNSYGGPGKSQAQLDAILQLNQAGILFVASAGNNARDNFSFPSYPGSHDAPNVIAVASTNGIDSLSDFSNFGARIVSMGAPGTNILSTVPNNSYAFFSGTSMASPHVAGGAALVLAANPNVTLRQLRGVLAFTGDVVPILQETTTTGRRLNLRAAIISANENDAVAPSAAASFAVSSQNGRDISLSWIAPGDDGAVGTAADYDIFFTSTQPNARPLLLPTKLLPAPAGTAQSATVSVPYRNFSGTITLRTYDNAGNSSDTVTSVAIPVNSGSDPYTVALSNPSALSTGGTFLNLLVGDDRYVENYQLPFAFPFYGKMRSTINISTNGALYFSRIPRDENDPATGTDASSSIEGLAAQEMISGMWDDLRTDGVAGGGVYVVQPNADTIIFRWQGKTFDTPLGGSTRGEQPVNFEIELRRDGTIVMRYGAGQAAPTNTRLFPVVGISAGEPDAYVIESHTSTALINLTNAQTVTFTPRIDSIGLKSPFDFDGDSKTDLSIFRPGPGEWWYLRSSDGSNRTFQFGSSSDKLVPADYTGDGKTDIAFFRPSSNEWFVLRSENNSFYSFPFGAAGDIPVPADYDGDGKADAAVYRPSNQTWFINRSSGGTTIQTFGIAGDIPVTADYDGDGKSDLAIYRPSQGQWWLLRSNLGIIVYQFGNSTDKLVQGDYTGDGKTDVAFFRPSTGEWFILRSENNSFYSFPFGASGDVPSPGDYDGDGKFDAAVFRPSSNTWFVQRSTSGTLIQSFGIAGDVSVPNSFVP